MEHERRKNSPYGYAWQPIVSRSPNPYVQAVQAVQASVFVAAPGISFRRIDRRAVIENTSPGHEYPCRDALHSHDVKANALRRLKIQLLRMDNTAFYQSELFLSFVT